MGGPGAARAQDAPPPPPPEAGTITGPARVIDADILIVDTTRVILWGIDAPERAQPCVLNGQDWGCYDAARRALQSVAERGAVTCRLLGEPDPFGRYFGQCLSGDTDLADEMVRAGYALAYAAQSTDYEMSQIDAITAEVGLWQPGVEFVEPWEWRRTHTPGGYR